MLQQRVRAIVDGHHSRLAYFRGLQQLPGSTWTDSDVAKAMERPRAAAADALYRAGLDADQVDELLGALAPPPRPARTLAEHMNAIIRGSRT